jgi:hypothetical protein
MSVNMSLEMNTLTNRQFVPGVDELCSSSRSDEKKKNHSQAAAHVDEQKPCRCGPSEKQAASV